VKRSHKIVFALIAAIALFTFVFGVLQFFTMPGRSNPPSIQADTNAPAR
jgi:hypothetical protein